MCGNDGCGDVGLVLAEDEDKKSDSVILTAFEWHGYKIVLHTNMEPKWMDSRRAFSLHQQYIDDEGLVQPERKCWGHHTARKVVPQHHRHRIYPIRILRGNFPHCRQVNVDTNLEHPAATCRVCQAMATTRDKVPVQDDPFKPELEQYWQHIAKAKTTFDDIYGKDGKLRRTLSYIDFQNLFHGMRRLLGIPFRCLKMEVMARFLEKAEKEHGWKAMLKNITKESWMNRQLKLLQNEEADEEVSSSSSGNDTGDSEDDEPSFESLLNSGRYCSGSGGGGGDDDAMGDDESPDIDPPLSAIADHAGDGDDLMADSEEEPEHDQEQVSYAGIPQLNESTDNAGSGSGSGSDEYSFDEYEFDDDDDLVRWYGGSLRRRSHRVRAQQVVISGRLVNAYQCSACRKSKERTDFYGTQFNLGRDRRCNHCVNTDNWDDGGSRGCEDDVMGDLDDDLIGDNDGTRQGDDPPPQFVHEQQRDHHSAVLVNVSGRLVYVYRCSACLWSKKRSDFSRTQLKKYSRRRCKVCVDNEFWGT